MAKNIVVCLDGTGNEFGDANSNVVKLYSVVAPGQVAYYHPGLGTRGAPNALTRLAKWWTKVLGLAFGYGLSANLADAYAFLMATYQPGDQVYIFGFSRGAYTARALCGMLHMFGLLRPHHEVLIPYMLRMMRVWKEKDRFGNARRFKATFSNECKPRFLGLWDTVSSVGWIYDPVKIPFTAKNADIRTVRHAISIDERRCFYRQNLMETAGSAQDLRQVWFSGVHSDVGGGYPKAETGLSQVALEWMLGEARKAGLGIDAVGAARVLADPPPDRLREPHRSLRGWWWLLEVWPKRHAVPPAEPGGHWTRRWKIPLGASRHLPADAELHPSVMERLEKLPGYRPKNLIRHISERQNRPGTAA